MGLFLQAVYVYAFNYFCIPLFIIVLIGKPRFLINLVHKLIEIKEPFKKIKIFRFILGLCLVSVIWSLYCKKKAEHLIDQIFASSFHDPNVANSYFIDEKIREAHLFERNAYMFSTFFVIILVIDNICHCYLKLWHKDDKFKELQAVEAEYTINKKIK